MKQDKNSYGRTMLMQYDWWRDNRKDVQLKLEALLKQAQAIDICEEFQLSTTRWALDSSIKILEQSVKDAKKAAERNSYEELLGWVGPYGALKHIAERCRTALEDYASDHDIDPNLPDMCDVASRLFQKKASRYGKWELREGVVCETMHVWAERKDVVVDLTYTQFFPGSPRVYVVPASRYCATEQGPLREIDVDESTVEQVEKLYRCDEFVKRKRK